MDDVSAPKSSEPQQAVVRQVTRQEVLDTLAAFAGLLHDYEPMLEQAAEYDRLDGEAAERVLAHREQALAGDPPFGRAVPVSVLLAYLLSRLPQESVTFHLPVRAEVLPEQEHPRIRELTRFMAQLRVPLDGLIAGVLDLARSPQAALHPKTEMLLPTLASCFKGIVRQDWADVELVLNHLNMVTTSRESHELVKQVARIVRNIYDTLNEFTQDYPEDHLSQSTQEIPDAVEKIYQVINELEESANRNLDLLEALSGQAGQDAEAVKTAQQVLAQVDERLAALGETEQDAAEALQAVRDELRAEVADRLATHTERLEANNDIYMTLFAHQSYQDLTGQTLKKVIAFIESLQYQLIQVITDGATELKPETKATARESTVEAGPDARNRLTQDKVDTLLAELGF